MIESFNDMLPWLTIVGSAGAAWGSVQISVSTSKAKIKETADELARHAREDADLHLDVVDRLARIETKIDQLKEAK